MDSLDQFTFWLAVLRGQNPEHKRGRCESGYWRLRQRDGRIVPLHLWREVGTGRLCLIRDHGAPEYVADEEAFAETVFAYCLRHPVRWSDYQHHARHGVWPDESLADFDREDKEHRAAMRARTGR